MNTLPVMSAAVFGAAGGLDGMNVLAALLLMAGAVLLGTALHLMARSER